MMTTFDDLMLALIASKADYSVRPGMVISATFKRREKRDAFRDRFTGSVITLAGFGFRLGHYREWCDGHGWGLILSPRLIQEGTT